MRRLVGKKAIFWRLNWPHTVNRSGCCQHLSGFPDGLVASVVGGSLISFSIVLVLNYLPVSRVVYQSAHERMSGLRIWGQG